MSKNEKTLTEKEARIAKEMKKKDRREMAGRVVALVIVVAMLLSVSAATLVYFLR